MMLKLAFEPEHALEVEEIAGHSNACYTLTARLEEDEITGYSNSKKCSECCTVGLTDVKLHGLKPDFSMCRWISGLERCEIAGHSNSRDSVRRTTSGLEEDEITWYSNQHCLQLVNRVGLAEDKIT